MTRFTRWFRVLAIALACMAVTLVMAGGARADKLHLKDGRVLEGTVVREVEGSVYFKVLIGGIEQEQFYTSDEIKSIERDTAPNPTGEVAKAVKPAEDSSKARSGATRVAILNFGPPSSWQGKVENTVGIEIGVKAFEDAVPLLEKDHVNVVVVRINSGGGLADEVSKFHDCFQKLYKPRFRTVGWVESAISAAAMSPYVLEEFYFMPEGNLGACTAFRGRLEQVEGIQLEVYLHLMEEASRMGGRDFKIMRSMQVQDALSATIDPNTGEVKWYQDTSGETVLNPSGQILTLTGNDAVKFKFARGIAATKEELVKAMGLQEVEWAGQGATDSVDTFMREADRTNKKLVEVYNKYEIALAAARSLGGPENKARRGAEVNRARRFLNEIKRMVGINPNFALMYPFDWRWFEEQERILRELMK